MQMDLQKIKIVETGPVREEKVRERNSSRTYYTRMSHIHVRTMVYLGTCMIILNKLTHCVETEILTARR